MTMNFALLLTLFDMFKYFPYSHDDNKNNNGKLKCSKCINQILNRESDRDVDLEY